MESPSSLRATVCCCFGQASGCGGAAAREFQYDPLNFDAGDLNVNSDDEEEMEVGQGVRARRGDGLLYHSFSSRLSTPVAVVEVA